MHPRGCRVQKTPFPRPHFEAREFGSIPGGWDLLRSLACDALRSADQPLDLEREVARRRTFAIISHPDAGKTTLTEKLLLYGGAIQQAGSVKTGKGRNHAASDWMEIERQRGISISSSAMQFEYQGQCINLLDTPGHQDFSEDTYRTLVAADSALMLIDGAKGVEPQTIKLFKVCRERGIPIVTVVNNLTKPLRFIENRE